MGLLEPVFKQLEDALLHAVLLLHLTQTSISLSWLSLPAPSSIAVGGVAPAALETAVLFSAPQALCISPSGRFVAIGYGGSILVSTPDGKVVSKPIPVDGGADAFGWCCGDRVVVRRRAEDGRIRGWRIYARNGTMVDELTVDADVREVLRWEISPDGCYLAYTGIPKHDGSCSLLLVIDLRGKLIQVLKRPFALTSKPRSLFWSGDSKQVCGFDGVQLWQLELATGALQWLPIKRFYAEPREPVFYFELATDGSGIFLVSERGEPEKPGKLSCFDIRTGARAFIAEGNFSDLSVRPTGVFACKRQSFRRDYPMVEREDLFIGRLQQCQAISFRHVVGGLAKAGGSIAYGLSHDGRRVVYIGAGVPLQATEVRELLPAPESAPLPLKGPCSPISAGISRMHRNGEPLPLTRWARRWTTYPPSPFPQKEGGVFPCMFWF